MHDSLLDLIQKRVVLLDGAMGTELMHYGFTQGTCPELWNEEKPDIIMSIYKNYFKAGSDAVLTNSFGGSIGPTGKFLKPQGTYSENDFEKSYFEQAKGLSDGGVDFLLIETQYDLQEARCAFKAAKKANDRPVFLTMTFNKTPHGFFTIMGNSIIDLINAFQDHDISGIGANCTLNSKDMADLIKIMRENTTLPLLAQANAGQPEMDKSGKVTYNQGIDNYVSFIPEIIKNGANIIGGCCGTDPEYIERIAHLIPGKI